MRTSQLSASVRQSPENILGNVGGSLDHGGPSRSEANNPSTELPGTRIHDNIMLGRVADDEWGYVSSAITADSTVSWPSCEYHVFQCLTSSY